MLVDAVLLMIYALGSLIHCYTDFREQILYDEISFAMLAAGVVYVSLHQEITVGLIGAVVVGGLFFLLFGFCQGGMGLGDVKLAVVLGAWLGWQQGLLALLLALCLGSIVGLALIVLTCKGRKDAIPFGPYLCMSGAVMLAYGRELLAWYSSFFV